MTVSTELCYAERTWTGVESAFAPGFPAQDIDHVKVQNLSALAVLTTLTRGVHFNVALAGDGSVTVTPIAVAMPPAPSTLLIRRVTPALQATDFENLEDFSATIHTRLHDAAAMRAAENKRAIETAVQPFVTTAPLVDFRPRRVAAADPINNEDLATRGYVLQITGILSLQGYVDQAAASATAAAGSATSAATAKTGAETARDLAQQWASNPIGVAVSGGEFSSKHYSVVAATQAGIATGYANLLNTVIHDWGDFQGATSVIADWGNFQ